ncbi:MAG: [protein-PII] uridylyltransferase [Actinomycetota bacterium]
MNQGMGSTPKIDRDELFADRSLVGTVFCRAYARRVDEWLQALFDQHLGGRPGISLVALGGYGRGELSPQSDLDVMLLHDGWAQDELEDAAQSLWFPIWDAHITLGHAVRTVSESIALAKDDLDTATSLLSLRHLAGDEELSDDLAEQSVRLWRNSRRKWLPRIIDDAAERAAGNGEVAFLLEPDLKVSSGGLRDGNAVEWIEAADIPVLDQERRDLRRAHEVLLAARVELHRSTNRKGDRLFLEEQDGVAEALGIADADVMMSEIAASARTITWIADDVFHRARRRLKRIRFRAERPRDLDEGVASIDGTICFTQTAPVGNDAALMLRLAVAAAEQDERIDRDSLDSLVELGPTIRTPWRPEIRDLFVRLLLTGNSAIPVIETLDHVGLFTRLLPEWEPNRSKVQRNQYHRFTVDRHLLEAAAIASDLVEQVDRPDLLVVGALLHDIGKGYPGDHTEVGVELIDTIATYMGFDPDDIDTLKRLCEHHLLLPDVATRRDLEDPGTIASVAEQVRTTSFLHLLAALTEADSIATGPSAWSRNKAHLLAELTRYTDQWLATDGGAKVESSFPDATQRELFAASDHVVQGEGDTLTVVTQDRPGTFAQVAGAIALNDLNIVGAQTHVEDGKVLEVVQVVHAEGEDHEIEWERVRSEVDDAVTSREDLGPHFEMRSKSRLRRVVRAPNPIEPIRVDFDNEVSSSSTIIEVAGPDRLGLLYELSASLADAGLDQQQTRVQTVGGDVVDSFYVRTLDGAKVTDPQVQASIRETLLAILERQTD